MEGRRRTHRKENYQEVVGSGIIKREERNKDSQVSKKETKERKKKVTKLEITCHVPTTDLLFDVEHVMHVCTYLEQLDGGLWGEALVVVIVHLHVTGR